MFQMRDAYWETTPPFGFSSYLGVSPFTPTFKLSKLFSLVSIVYLIIMLYVALTVFIYMENVNSTFQLSSFSLILERAQLIIITASVAISIIKGLFNSKDLSQVLKVLVRVDKDLREIGVFVDTSRRFGIITLCVRLILVCTTLMFDFSLFTIRSLVASLILEYMIIMPILVSNLVQIQFMVLINSVRNRIDTMTIALRNFSSKSYSGKERKLQVFAVVHSALIEVCNTINSLYSIQILIILSSVFIITTANLYHIIEKTLTFLTEKNYNDFNTLFTIIFRVVSRSFEVWTLITTCVDMQDKAKEFHVLFYQIMLEDKTRELVENPKLQLHVSMKKEVVFSACGFFPMDYTLVHSMISAATTYLVILIQFSQITTDTPTADRPSENSTHHVDSSLTF